MKGAKTSRRPVVFSRPY